MQYNVALFAIGQLDIFKYKTKTKKECKALVNGQNLSG